MKARKMFRIPFCISLRFFAAESLNLHFYHGQLTLLHVFDVMITRRPFHSPCFWIQSLHPQPSLTVQHLKSPDVAKSILFPVAFNLPPMFLRRA